MQNIYITILTATDDVIIPNNEDCTSRLNEKKKTHTLISAIGMAGNRASTSDTQEIATSNLNLHLTSRVRVELESSLQGHLKVLSKLTRGIERANHHTDLLQAAIDSMRSPRGLIPKVTPKIPDTPGTFTIEWEGSLQKVGLILTEKLKRLLEREIKKTRTRVLLYPNKSKTPH